MGTLLAATPAHGSGLPRANAAPIGQVDSVTVAGDTATITGWTIDPNQPNTSIQVHIYVYLGGAVRYGTPFFADDVREDVNRAFGIRGSHGFSRSVKLYEGRNSVCAFGVGPTTNSLLGCWDLDSGDGSSYRIALSASFDGLPWGPVSPATFNSAVGSTNMNAGAYDDMVIVGDTSRGGTFLRTTLKAGTIHSKPGGDNGTNLFVALPNFEKACLQYDVRFDAGFNFSLGGKLPGLGGVAPGVRPALPTGGGRTDLGWSGRLMWVGPKAYKWAGPSNMAVSYMYHPTQAGTYGDNVRWDQSFAAGKWHTVRQCHVLNTVGQANGKLMAWMDGRQVVNASNYVYRTRSEVAINQLIFSIFRGGNTMEWAGNRDGYVDIDNLSLTYG